MKIGGSEAKALAKDVRSGFREGPALVVWRRSDAIFSQQGAEAYKRDLKSIEVHFLDTGHFAVAEKCDIIAGHIRRFLEYRT